jgi:hypothetical protein
MLDGQGGRVTNLLADFATMFPYAWYRDFPVDVEYRPGTKTFTDWSIHTAASVRYLASLLGLYVHFEEARVDGTIRNNEGRAIAPVEWEWNDAYVGKFNEVNKLLEMVQEAQFSVLIAYASVDRIEYVKGRLAQDWKETKPLLAFLISRGPGLAFGDMHRLKVVSGQSECLGPVPALPWNVKESRWERRVKPLVGPA